MQLERDGRGSVIVNLSLIPDEFDSRLLRVYKSAEIIMVRGRVDFFEILRSKQTQKNLMLLNKQ